MNAFELEPGPADRLTRLARLAQTTFGAGLTPRCQQSLSELAALVSVKAGQLLFREGVENADVYLLLRGRIDLAMTVPGRGAVRIMTLGPGEMIAWSAVVGDGRMTCSARCMEDSELLAFPGPALREMMEGNHDLGFEFMRVLATALTRRLVATRLQLLDLFSANEPLRGNSP